jgi:ribosomal protein S11
MATVTTTEEMGNRIHDLKLKNIYIIFHGGARFRNAALRGLRRAAIPIGGLIIESTTPYNGCRLKKKRRI